MKPGIDQMLLSAVTTLATRIRPELSDESYAAGDAGMVAANLILVMQMAESTADTLFRENAAMRAMFARVSGKVGDPLREPLATAAQTEDANLRISTLEAGHAALSALLIDLHTWAEAHDPALNAEIWSLLSQGAADRMLEMPVM